MLLLELLVALVMLQLRFAINIKKSGFLTVRGGIKENLLSFY